GSSRLTSKGQMTLPKGVLDLLALRTGDRLDVAVEGRRIILTPKTLHVRDICSLLPAPDEPVSVEEMNDAIARAGAGE
ncbi:MAG: AbrB/MazE/SpoVT family DNA-binding domain-containing protein, partial [Candidatus Eremiobacteraeota bacterium]|nr:AbrB/MazE/SpoVT family DNA-binding domain-containing protein [Candidatus Eremiobacteraeota bacterium]